MDQPHGNTNQADANENIGIMDRLRVATAQQHEDAENHPFQQAFFAGRLKRESYVRYLVELHHLYQGLENQIRESSAGTPDLASVVVDENLRVGDLSDDLHYFDARPEDAAPTPTTKKFLAYVSELSENCPIALLGLHYVLEGSNNGSKFIARNIRRAYDLAERGVRTFDPYGSDQRQRWLEYKTRMGRLKLTAAQEDAIVEAAKQMFRLLGSVSSDLMPEQLQEAIV
ncbi:MAG: biliverdin-producing heme oxygenase [Planctomycetes bacterium]|nr:biliverdin-producing heme oxygenase [Planctomycetota bacterium]